MMISINDAERIIREISSDMYHVNMSAIDYMRYQPTRLGFLSIVVENFNDVTQVKPLDIENGIHKYYLVYSKKKILFSTIIPSMNDIKKKSNPYEYTSVFTMCNYVDCSIDHYIIPSNIESYKDFLAVFSVLIKGMYDKQMRTIEDIYVTVRCILLYLEWDNTFIDSKEIYYDIDNPTGYRENVLNKLKELSKSVLNHNDICDLTKTISTMATYRFQFVKHFGL